MDHRDESFAIRPTEEDAGPASPSTTDPSTTFPRQTDPSTTFPGQTDPSTTTPIGTHAHPHPHAAGETHSHPHSHAPDETDPHAHPHPSAAPSGNPRIAFVGAGRVGSTLAVAFSTAGWPVTAVASRDPERRDRFRAQVPTAVAVEHPGEVVEAADLVFITVPDDAIPRVAGSLRLYGGQGIVHTSGALSAEVLAPALAAGSRAASFHPLVAFADPARALADLAGATIAIEGDPGLVALLGRLAQAIGAQPVQLPPGGKAAYHAAAVLAAGGFIGLLDAIAELGRGAGLDEAGALAIYGPLIRQSLANAATLGIAGALTGPLLRGDAGTVRGHLEAMDRLAPGAHELYVAAARREIDLALRRGELDDPRAVELRMILDDHR
jgi:predicted short-subunit dehydrogenase-like oxidoreductase (DUF2520 family)